MLELENHHFLDLLPMDMSRDQFGNRGDLYRPEHFHWLYFTTKEDIGHTVQTQVGRVLGGSTDVAIVLFELQISKLFSCRDVLQQNCFFNAF